MQKKALFRFEASIEIGVGHAMRCCVIADALVERGWECSTVTSQESYKVVKNLGRFKRIDPEEYAQNPIKCDLLVVDHYDLEVTYEQRMRPFVQKILVIDDLANRMHDCDILLDQTYGRDTADYEKLVPNNCKILTGIDYVLLRKEIIEMRPSALEKRRQTSQIKRILISMGGTDPGGYTLQALRMVQEADFRGHLDIVLGFSKHNLDSIEEYMKDMPNEYTIHFEADMPQLMYGADLAIGAAGSSVWERSYLGLPQVLIQTADNQKNIYALSFSRTLKNYFQPLQTLHEDINVDGFGINRLLLKILSQDNNECISFISIQDSDKDKIFQWQQLRDLRKYFHNPNPPSISDHEQWFLNRLKCSESPYWLIRCDSEDCGVLSLTYNKFKEGYDLSWFVIPECQGKGIGTASVALATQMVHPNKIFAHVKEDNIASQKALKNLGFVKIKANYYISRVDRGIN